MPNESVFPTKGKSADKVQNYNALFPSRLRKLREDSGHSQNEFAAAIGVTRSTVSLYESGINLPDVETFSKIADFYNVSYDYLLGKSASKQRENMILAEQLGLNDNFIYACKLGNSQIEAEREIGKPILDWINSAFYDFESIMQMSMFFRSLNGYKDSYLQYLSTIKKRNSDIRDGKIKQKGAFDVLQQLRDKNKIEDKIQQAANKFLSNEYEQNFYIQVIDETDYIKNRLEQVHARFEILLHEIIKKGGKEKDNGSD